MQSHGDRLEADRSTTVHETVLLVEDDVVIRDLVGTILGKAGYTVLEAQSVYDATDIAATHEGPIHLLITDMVMPGMFGADLARQLGERRPEMRVLYISGYVGTGALQKAGVSAGEPFLAKPFTAENLTVKVRDVLEGRA